MFNLPVAQTRAGMPSEHGSTTLFRRTLGLTALLLSLAFFPTASANAQAPKDIITKTLDVYLKATAFQSSVTIKSGKATDAAKGSMVITQQIKYKSPNMFSIQVSATGTGPQAAKAADAGGLVVSDGKMIYQYSNKQKQYAKQAAPATLPLQTILRQYMPNPNNEITVLPEANVQGRATVVLAIKPKIPATATAAQKETMAKQLKTMKATQLFVDKQTHQILKISLAGGAAVIEFNSQSLTPTFAPNTFAFTPPPGAKEFVPPPAGGAPGGIPGITPGGTPPGKR